MAKFLIYDITKLHSLAITNEFTVSWNDHQIILLSPNFIAYVTEDGRVEQHAINPNASPKIHQLDHGSVKDNYRMPKQLFEECKRVANGMNIKRAKLTKSSTELLPLKPVYSHESIIDIKQIALKRNMQKAINAYKQYTGKASPVTGSMARPYVPPKYAAIIGSVNAGKDTPKVMVWKKIKDAKTGLMYSTMTEVSNIADIVSDPNMQYTRLQIGGLVALLRAQAPLNCHNFHRVPIKAIKNGSLQHELDERDNPRNLSRKD